MLRSFVLRHIVLLRFLSLWPIPLAMVIIPSVAYIQDSRAGILPDKHEYEMGHDSGGGPWAGNAVVLTMQLLGFFGVVGSIVGAIVARWRGGLPGAWLAHAGLVIVAAIADFALFAWLID